MVKRARLRGRLLVIAACLVGLVGCDARAQSGGTGLRSEANSPDVVPASGLPEQVAQARAALGEAQSGADQQPEGSIYGTVVDPNDAVVEGARVTLEMQSAQAQQTVLTGANGFFHFSALLPGPYRVRITSPGFGEWTSAEIVLPALGSYEVARIALKIPVASTDVHVTLSVHDVAEEQIKAQEQQRILAVFPNFYASYVWHAAPMTAGQKFRLALRTSIDPVTFAADGITAAIEQSQGYLSGYGTGAEGYAKRFGAAYADDVVGTFIGSAVLPSILHQDPRFFYKANGSVGSRALYAISTVVICRGDNGRWQPNYSNIFGNLIAAGISNLYYPESDRNNAGVTVQNALVGTAEGAITALLQEFVMRKISRGVQHTSATQP